MKKNPLWKSRLTRFAAWALTMYAAFTIAVYIDMQMAKYIPALFMMLMVPMVLMPFRKTEIQ